MVSQKLAGPVIASVAKQSHSCPPSGRRGCNCLKSGDCEACSEHSEESQFPWCQVLYFSALKERLRVCFVSASQPLRSSQWPVKRVFTKPSNIESRPYGIL